jgi:Bacterial Ig-like domain (group 1)/Bacterial Ig-like domain (group 2)
VVGNKSEPTPALRPHGLISHAWRWGAGVISAGAGLVSILSYTHSIKAKFDPDTLAVGSLSAVRWVGVTPRLDTATAIGDTIHLAATATDARGNALLGAATFWSSMDSTVAMVDSAGTVVSMGEGTTTVMATVGGKVARAHVIVRQQPAELRVVGDTLFRVPEGDHGTAVAHVVDARGHEIRATAVRWRSADPSIATVDSFGYVSGVAPGRTTFAATYQSMVVQLPAEVYPVPASLTLLGGEGQKAAAGRRVSQPVSVQVVSRSGRPIEGVAVRFVVEEGAGRAEPQADSSDAQGIARSFWTLAGAPGRQTLTVSAQGVATPTLVTAEAEPVAANTRVVVVSEGIAGPAGEPMVDPVAVRVTDSSGVALADVPVAWAANDDGSIVAVESRTDSLGEARARWTLGPKSGSQHAYVQVGSPRAIPRFTVTASALAGGAAKMSVVGTAKREGAVSQVLRSLELRVLDKKGNPVPGAAITLEPASGSVADTVVTTDSMGTAIVSWTLGRTVGVQHLTAQVEKLDHALVILARAKAAPAANLVFVGPKPGTANRAVQSLDADLTDAYGNPVSDQPVVFSTRNGSVSPARVMTDAHGRAHTRWTPGSKIGERTLVAAVKGTEARAAFVLKAPELPVAAKKVISGSKEAPAKKAATKRASH